MAYNRLPAGCQADARFRASERGPRGELLVSALAGRYLVRIGHPLALGDRSEPEPDVAVVHRGDYRRAHPRTALVIIESASSGRRRDLGFKAKLYARHGMPEYWVVDLDAAQIVVHTQPRPIGYTRLTLHDPGHG